MDGSKEREILNNSESYYKEKYLKTKKKLRIERNSVDSIQDELKKSKASEKSLRSLLEKMCSKDCEKIEPALKTPTKFQEDMRRRRKSMNIQGILSQTLSEKKSRRRSLPREMKGSKTSQPKKRSRNEKISEKDEINDIMMECEKKHEISRFFKMVGRKSEDEVTKIHSEMIWARAKEIGFDEFHNKNRTFSDEMLEYLRDKKTGKRVFLPWLFWSPKYASMNELMEFVNDRVADGVNVWKALAESDMMMTTEVESEGESDCDSSDYEDDSD